MTRVLFVDDEPMVLTALRRSLASYRDRYEFAFAPGVSEALAELDTHGVDFIVSDLDMPGRTGLEFVRILRADPRFEQTPFVLLSGNISPAAAEEATAAGVTTFLHKPVPADEVVAKIQGLLAA